MLAEPGTAPDAAIALRLPAGSQQRGLAVVDGSRRDGSFSSGHKNVGTNKLSAILEL